MYVYVCYVCLYTVILYIQYNASGQNGTQSEDKGFILLTPGSEGPGISAFAVKTIESQVERGTPQAFTHRRTRYMRARSDEPGTLAYAQKHRERKTHAAGHGTQSTFSVVLKRIAQSNITKYLLSETLKTATRGEGGLFAR